MIDFIHVDVNGAETEFIEGARETLNNHTKYLWMEFMSKTTGHWDDARDVTKKCSLISSTMIVSDSTNYG